MAKHPTILEFRADNFVISIDPLELAVQLSRLRYDSLASYLQKMSTEIQIDAEQDAKGGRVKLADCLQKASSCLDQAKEAIDKAWTICQKKV